MTRSTPPATDPVGVVGLGRVGSHVARQLRSGSAPLQVFDSNPTTTHRVLGALRPIDSAPRNHEVSARTVVLATPAGRHTAAAAALIRTGSSVISTSDDPQDVRGLLALNDAAQRYGVTVVAGVGLSPGYSCLQALFASLRFERVDELSVWTTGTAGPACAKRHHRSLQLSGQVIIDGQWVDKRGGSGRDLAWFPGELGARDCYRGALAEPILLHRLFPEAQRISSRTSATRRDRLTGALPMLRKPHLDGGPGGIRVEVRGLAASGYRTEVVGMMGFPSVAAGVTAAVTALHVHHGTPPTGAMGVAELVDGDPGPLLADLHARGVTASRFEGSSQT